MDTLFRIVILLGLFYLGLMVAAWIFMLVSGLGSVLWEAMVRAFRPRERHLEPWRKPGEK